MLATKITVFGKTIPAWIAALALVAATAGAATGVVLAGNVTGDIVTTVDQSLLVDETDVTDMDATYATGTLTFAVNAVDTNTVTIGGVIYTYTTASPPANPNGVKVGGTSAVSRDNLVAAINLAAGSGSIYGSGTALHPTVSAAVGSGDTLIATAKDVGTGGNGIGTADALAGASGWVTGTLLGGTGALKAAQFNAVSDDRTRFTAATEIMTGDGARVNVVAVNRSTDAIAVSIKLDLMPGITADIDGADDAGSTTSLGGGTGDSCVRMSLSEWKCKLAATAADGASDFRIKLALNDEVPPGFYTTSVTMTQIENKS